MLAAIAAKSISRDTSGCLTSAQKFAQVRFITPTKVYGEYTLIVGKETVCEACGEAKAKLILHQKMCEIGWESSRAPHWGSSRVVWFDSFLWSLRGISTKMGSIQKATRDLHHSNHNYDHLCKGDWWLFDLDPNDMNTVCDLMCCR